MRHKPTLLLTVSLIAVIALLSSVILAIGLTFSPNADEPVLDIDPHPTLILRDADKQTIELTGRGLDGPLQSWLTPESSGRLATIASLETFGTPRHLLIRDQRLYLATSSSGLLLVDITDQTHPRTISALKLPASAIRLALQDDLIAVATGMGGLQLARCRAETSLQLLSAVPEASPAIGVAIHNNYAYVASSTSGLRIIDISDPYHPQLVTTLTSINPAINIACQDNTMIVSLGNGKGIVVLDCSLPQAPREVARLPLPGLAGYALALQKDRALLGVTSDRGMEANSSLYAIDLSVPSQPRVTMETLLPGTSLDLSWSNDRAVVSLGGGGLRIFDTKDPLHPRTTAAYLPPGSCQSVAMRGEAAWIADSRGQVVALDINSSTLPLPTAAIEPLSLTGQHIVKDGRLYLVDSNRGLNIYDINASAEPRLLGTFAFSNSISRLALHYPLLFIGTDDRNSTGGRLLVLDVSAPAAPQLVSTMNVVGIPQPLGMIGSVLAVYEPLSVRATRARQPARLLLVDLSAPRQPALVLSRPLPATPSGIALDEENHLSVIYPDGIFQLFDLSPPPNFTLLGQLEMPWVQRSDWHDDDINIVFHHDTALVASKVSGIKVISLEDHRKPTLLGTIDAGGKITSMVLADNLLIASLQQHGIVVIDLAAPEPQSVARLDLSGTTQQLAVMGNTLWYAYEGNRGLYSAYLPQKLEIKNARNGRSAAVTLPRKLPEGDYSLWLSRAGGKKELPGLIRIRRG